jgi:DNA-binding CsgD family transcriptional regulator
MGHHNGPFVIEHNKATPISGEKGAWDFVEMPGNREKFILGTYSGISLLQSTNQKLDYIRKFKGLDESSRVLQFDSEGNLWMAHGYKGLFKIKFDKAFEQIESLRFYNSKDGLPSDQLVNMEKIRNELVFPALYGVFRYDKATDRFMKDDIFSSYFNENEHVAEMEEDIQGNIYFISNERVGRLSIDAFNKANMEDRLFIPLREYLNDDLSNIHVLDMKNVLFGAKEGFIHFNANKVKPFNPFHTHITHIINISQETDSLLYTGRMTEKDPGLSLPYAHNSLRFIYASSFYESPEKTQYRFYLENFDMGWSEWTSKTEKEYTNLPEGDYIFHVQARNIFGTLSSAKSFHFQVKPPYYRSHIAYTFYTLLSMVLLGLTFFQAEKRFRKEKTQLMLDKEKQLEKKDKEIISITNQSEQEIVKLRNEKLQSEVDHMNRELASSTIHLIQKNELLSSVKQELQHILKDGEKSGHAEELRKIIKSIDSNITNDESWKQFEMHFNHVHGDFTKRLLEKYPSLTPIEFKLSTYLRLNLSTKEIAQLLNISVRGVEISRYRLRKRLNLDRNENLTDFMLRF